MQSPAEDDLIPIRAVRCPFCAGWVPVDTLTVLETLWMHEYDCVAITKDWELAA
jgi:hypothetical protein